jgi:hypothetical protein
MVFFLSLRSGDAPTFLAEAQALLDKQPAALAKRFQPALDGLRMATEEPHRWTASSETAPFLGWWRTDRWRTPQQGRWAMVTDYKCRLRSPPIDGELPFSPDRKRLRRR